MKRRTLTIVSIVSIIIISLLLLSLTYGYYLTTIEGNTNSKSVEVATGDTKVLYTDLSEDNTSEIIKPGFKTVKSFTVQNIGNVSATYSVYLVDVINSFSRTQDITYNLYKKVGTITNVNIDTDLSETNGWSRVNTTENMTFPTEMSVIAPNEVIETPNLVYTYVLKVEYINHPTENQNEDQGKTFGFKVNLRAQDSEVNPFSEGTLAYNIIENVQNGNLEGKTTFTPNLSAVSMVNTGTTINDKILSTAQDDWGTSYYFRGNPIDNYVEYAGMCWRIVRIQGDGSTKLILASELSCNETDLTNDSGLATDGAKGTKGTILSGHYGYKIENGYNINDYKNSTENIEKSAKTQLNTWLNTKITEDEQSVLKNNDWCIGDLTNAYSFNDTGEIIGKVEELISTGTSFKYNAGNKYYVTQTPSYKCEATGKNEEIDTNKVGMLTFDEIVYAGGGNISNSNYYLNNNATLSYWWALSPYVFDADNASVVSTIVRPDGAVGGNYVNHTGFNLRPVISLKSGVTITEGVGTIDNPYIIG